MSSCAGAMGQSVYIVAARASKSAIVVIQYRQAMMFPTKLYRQFPTWKSSFHAENAVRKHSKPLKKQIFPLFPHGWDPSTFQRQGD